MFGGVLTYYHTIVEGFFSPKKFIFPDHLTKKVERDKERKNKVVRR